MVCHAGEREGRVRPGASWALLGLLLVLGALLAVVLGGRPTAAEGPTLGATPGTIRLVQQTTVVGISHTATVEVWLDGVADFYGIDVKLAFDPSLVRVPTGQVTPVWDLFDADNHILARNVVSNTAGTVLYVVANMNPSLPFTGTGRLCTITFEGLAPGSSALHFTQVRAADRDADPFYPVQVDGAIEVLGEGAWHRVYLPLTRRH